MTSDSASVQLLARGGFLLLCLRPSPKVPENTDEGTLASTLSSNTVSVSLHAAELALGGPRVHLQY